MSISFPDVPFAAGVPAVLRDASNMNDGENAILMADSTSSASSDDWGIFDTDGNRVIFPDSMIAVEYGGERRISDYPVEKGGFQSYNKVAVPFELRVTMTKGGAVADRSAFITGLELLHNSLSLVDVATPEKVYSGVNMTHLGQARSAQSGAGMATMEMVFQEVRETVSIAYAQNATDSTATAQAATTPAPKPALTAATVKTPAVAKPINQGSVQTKAVSSSAKLVTASSGAKLYVYDKAIGL